MRLFNESILEVIIITGGHSNYCRMFSVTNDVKKLVTGVRICITTTRAVNSIDFYLSSSSSSACFSKSQFKFGKNIKAFKFKFRLTKILNLLFDLIALFLYTICCVSRSPWHKQVNGNLNLHGTITISISFRNFFNL